MDDLYGRDPEEIGPEHPDDLNSRMSFIESRHWYIEGNGDGCQEPTNRFCHTHDEVDYCRPCGATQSSVLHFDMDERTAHDHGGGDCMCFENQD